MRPFRGPDPPNRKRRPVALRAQARLLRQRTAEAIAELQRGMQLAVDAEAEHRRRAIARVVAVREFLEGIEVLARSGTCSMSSTRSCCR